MTADRAYIFEQNDRGTFDNTYEWCKAGVSKEKDNLQDVPYEGIIETWFDNFKNPTMSSSMTLKNAKKQASIYERLKPQGVNTLCDRAKSESTARWSDSTVWTILPKRNCMRSRI